MTIETADATAPATKPADAAALTATLGAIVAQAVEVRKAATAESLLFNYVLNNGAPKDRHLQSMMKVMQTAVDLGYESWPAEIRNLSVRRDLLHIDCGSTLYGPVFRALGTTSYTGIDKQLTPTRKKFRSHLEKKNVDTGFSMVDVMRLIPGLSYMQTEEIVFREAFDLALMQAVTHTTPSVQTLFSQIHRSLRPNGEIWFMHENFYSWSGHLTHPRTPSKYDPSDTGQATMVDWGHIDFPAPEGHRLGAFNRLTLTELRKITNAYFEVSQWIEIPERSSVKERLTPALRAKLSAYSDSDLTTKQIVCRAVKRELF
ncbi:methyltransferase domain-containing protein [Hydrocarboniphaga sp.]|uniref:methyltransferase domain-containing protein n=1 Tax=Hydrocarboniphaga sp. TaxID=2033016 RepID=UPI00262F0298|nr:methyltransferase domain-containing protein [Hydrocarboniphaga sp.]